MEKIMRNAPGLIVIVVMALTVPRVAEFGDRIGVWKPFAVIFALFLMLSIYTLSFFQARTANYKVTADKDSEKRSYNAQVKMQELFSEIHGHSTLWLILFVLIDGFVNLSETMTEVESNVEVWSWTWLGAILYGAMPTLAAYGMGNLQALVSKLPGGATGASHMELVFNAFMRRMQNALDADAKDANASETHQTHPAKKKNRNADAYPKPCPHCGAPQPNANAYSAHMRWTHGPQGTHPIGFQAFPVNKAATTTPETAQNAPISAGKE